MQIPDPFKTPQNRHVDQRGHADHESEVRSAAHMIFFLTLKGPAWMKSSISKISAFYPYAFSSNPGKTVWKGGTTPPPHWYGEG